MGTRGRFSCVHFFCLSDYFVLTPFAYLQLCTRLSSDIIEQLNTLCMADRTGTAASGRQIDDSLASEFLRH